MQLDMKYIRSIRLEREHLSKDTYYSQIPAIASVGELFLSSNITFFVGENGSGKSTLLEAIAVAYGFNPEGGSLNYNFSSRDTHSELSSYILLGKGIKRPKDSFFSACRKLL